MKIFSISEMQAAEKAAVTTHATTYPAMMAQAGLGVATVMRQVLGTYLHGMAGNVLSETVGTAGLLATELADALPIARMRLTKMA